MTNEWLGDLNLSDLTVIGGSAIAVFTSLSTCVVRLKKVAELEDRLSKAEGVLTTHKHSIEYLQKNEQKFDSTLKTINSTLVDLNGTVRELKGIVETSKR
ncbi:TPA: hypothetical protein PMC50_002505 [Vibrio cholerae]|nr:hypothetical protein [Vibrio cholerae]